MLANEDPVKHFLSSVEYVDDHWLWTGSLNGPNGYGVAYVGNYRYELAHIRAYKLFVGAVPDKQFLRHTEGCPFKRCVNPNHLKPGTPKENVDDMFSFGGRGNGKLTDEQILHIRYSSKSRRELAELYGATDEMVWSIQRGLTWKHLTLLSPILVKYRPRPSTP